ncbi:MAG: hypothetical protein HZA51_09615 [Planctomycetes bacterium]|nr:hypothetical protein [Planctomycetota bacterium]
MNIRPKVVLALVGSVVVIVMVFFWWQGYRVRRYGGIKEFMTHLHEHHKATASELSRSGENLPEDFIEMERLAQGSQDIYAVFAPDPRVKDSRFTPKARELIRQATLLEQSWDDARPADARRAFADLTEACNACHRDIAQGAPPRIENPIQVGEAPDKD